MKILCEKAIHPCFEQTLQNSGYEFDIYTGNSSNDSEIDVLVTTLTQTVNSQYLNNFPGLKLVLNYAVGFNNIDIDYCLSRGILVGNTPGVLTEATAHHTLLLMLAASRHLKPSIQNIYKDEWLDWEPLGFLGPDVTGKTLGIYGMGRIGFYFAKLCHQAFSMDVIYHNRKAHPKAQNIGAKQVSFDELAEEADFLSIHAPLTDQNRYVFNKEVFARMKSGAVFINTSRGGLVNHDDLYQSLKNGELFAAGLDVTEPEPVTNNYPLLTLDNCVITPHTASATYEARRAMAKCVVENIFEYLENGRLKYAVN
ncbi:MAG: D-glycerate dehydrogenase [Gammaproteobacteria bacterium]|nr:D-glycerate dehydrogenase [Gammaproteobacteria bacterium]